MAFTYCTPSSDCYGASDGGVYFKARVYEASFTMLLALYNCFSHAGLMGVNSYGGDGTARMTPHLPARYSLLLSPAVTSHCAPSAYPPGPAPPHAPTPTNPTPQPSLIPALPTPHRAVFGLPVPFPPYSLLQPNLRSLSICGLGAIAPHPLPSRQTARHTCYCFGSRQFVTLGQGGGLYCLYRAGDGEGMLLQTPPHVRSGVAPLSLGCNPRGVERGGSRGAAASFARMLAPCTAEGANGRVKLAVLYLHALPCAYDPLLGRPCA